MFDKEAEDEICTPVVKEIENKFHSADFNCNNCNQTDCCYWVLYNERVYDFAENSAE